MSRKRYLVLGGNGFIGRNLCSYIAGQGNLVTSFDRVLPEGQDASVSYVHGDFFDDVSLQEMVAEFDVIIHAISTINPGNSNEFYMRGYEKDFVQTVKMCSWLKDTNKKILFLSSGGTVYGNCNKQPITEDTLPQPINHYGNVKLCIENALRIFHIQNCLNITIVRISNPYGPGQDYTKGVGFVDAVLKQALEGKTVEIWGDGENIRDYIYIQDVCGMLYSLAEYTGEDIVFNVSSNRGISQKQVINSIKRLGVSVKVDYREQRSVDARKIVLDNSRALRVYKKNLLTFDEGIEKYYRYLMCQGLK